MPNMCDALALRAYDLVQAMDLRVAALATEIGNLNLMVTEMMGRPVIDAAYVEGVVAAQVELLKESLKPAPPPEPEKPATPPEPAPEAKEKEPASPPPPPPSPPREKQKEERAPERRHVLHNVVELPGTGRRKVG